MKKFLENIKPIVGGLALSFICGFGGFMGVTSAAKFTGVTLAIGYQSENK